MKRLLFLAFICIISFSCDQSDGNDRTPFEYRVMAGANQVTAITFTGANGEPANVDPDDFSDNWSQRIWVVKPFNASATVALSNPTASEQEFVLQIYRRNAAVATVVDTIPAMGETTSQVSGTISD